MLPSEICEGRICRRRVGRSLPLQWRGYRLTALSLNLRENLACACVLREELDNPLQ